MKQTKKQIKKISTATIEAINHLSPDELEAHDIIQRARTSGYVCPLCGSGEGRKQCLQKSGVIRENATLGSWKKFL